VDFTGSGTLTNLNYGADMTLPAGTAVTLAGTVTFPTIHMTGASSLRVAPGGTVNGEIVAEGAATGTRTVQFAFGGNGTGTIGASGVIRLDPTSGGPLLINDSSNVTLVNKSPQSSWTNAGTLDMDGGTLNLVTSFNATSGIGTWDRSGGTVNVTGTITNTGSTIALNSSTGSWNLSGGTISGGSITLANGAGLVMTSSGTLTNLSYGADLSLPVGTGPRST